MLKLRALLLFPLIAGSGCGSEPEQAEPPGNSSPPAAKADPDRRERAPQRQVAEPVKPSAGSKDAANVLRRYYDAIGQHRYDEAWSLRWKGRGDDEKSRQAFSERMKRYLDYRANVGQAGPVLEARGYSYVDVPVQIYGRTVDGQPFSTAGTVTLRRKGTEPWRIYSRD